MLSWGIFLDVLWRCFQVFKFMKNVYVLCIGHSVRAAKIVQVFEARWRWKHFNYQRACFLTKILGQNGRQRKWGEIARCNFYGLTYAF